MKLKHCDTFTQTDRHPLLLILMTHLHKVRESHKVAVSVDDEGGGEVAGLDEEEGRVHPEYGGVGELEEHQSY